MSFLSRLEASDRTLLERRWSLQRHSRGSVIIGQGDETQDVFFLLEGHARVSIYSESGRIIAYRDLDAGQVFGELAAIDGQERSASVLALDAVTIGRLPRSGFRELVDGSPNFRWALLTHLAGEMRRMTERVYEFSTLVVRKRLIRELLRLARQDIGGVATIRPVPTHADLAAKISTHREAVSREMSALAGEHLIERRRASILLLDVAALANIATESG